MANPEARVLGYFLAVAEERNFTRAAARLNIAQPALSAQIRRLESQLGVTLLTRTTRSVRLTPAGEAVLAHGPQALAALDRVWNTARRVGRGEAGEATLGYSPSAGSETLPMLVEAIGARYPDLHVSAQVLPSPQIPPEVAAGRIDAGIARAAQPCPGTRRIMLRRERRGVLVAAGHPLARRRRVELAAAARYPIILHARSANPGHHDEVRELFATAGLRPQFVEPPVALDPSQQLVRSGGAIGLTGESSLAAVPKQVRWVPLADPATAVTVHLVLPSAQLTPLQRRIRAVAAELAHRAGWLPHDP